MNSICNSALPWGSNETLLFLELTPERVLEAVESAGFKCTGRCLQLNSMENRVFEVEIETTTEPTSARDRFKVVKFYRPGRWTAQQILEEHTFLNDLIEHELPVVTPLELESGSTLGKIQDTNFYFSVFPKIGGRNCDELTNENSEQLGRLIARLHSVGKSRKATERVVLNVETYGESNLQALEDLGYIPVHLESRFFDLAEQLLDYFEEFFDESESQRIHGDCHLGNILLGAEGLFLVDFDDMVVGPPMQDIWLLLPGRDQYAQRLLEKFIAGYNQMGSFDRKWLLLIEPLRALRIIHFNSWIAKRWKDESFRRVFPDFLSESYWSDQVRSLEDVSRSIDENCWR